MPKYFHMDTDQFDKWVEKLIDEGYDWKQIGISNDYCNKISEQKYGLRLINWSDRSFQIVNEKKLTLFLIG